RIGEVLSLHASRIIFVIGDVGLRRAVEPAEPFVLVISGPYRLVLAPEPPDLGLGAPFLAALVHRLLDRVAKREFLRINGRTKHGCALGGDGAVKLVGGIREEFYTIPDQ